MNGEDWRRERDSRSLLYAGRVLDRNRWVSLCPDPRYVSRYDGQVALLTAANLLGRMTPSIALDIPDSIPIVDSLPNAGKNLRDVLLDQLHEADPSGSFCRRSYKPDDYIIRFGKTGGVNTVHGSGWKMYCGPSPSPLAETETVNPIGPAMASILAVSEAFRTNLTSPPGQYTFDALTWTSDVKDESDAPLPTQSKLGEVWVVGTGSVGTAVLYFLSLATRNFSAVLFDMDIVEIHNLDRSPIFTSNDADNKTNKAIATKRYLNQVGVSNVKAEPHALDESDIWKNRQPGTPDVLVPTANERNVRSLIESYFPPIQVYGTTGQNGQATMIRHIPPHDPCSLCLFPDTDHAPTSCAIGKVENESNEKKIDAALPFLSFAAGAMAVAEILKLSLPDYPANRSNRTILYTGCPPRFTSGQLSFRDGCPCRQRNYDLYRKITENTCFSHLMRFS